MIKSGRTLLFGLLALVCFALPGPLLADDVLSFDNLTYGSVLVLSDYDVPVTEIATAPHERSMWVAGQKELSMDAFKTFKISYGQSRYVSGVADNRMLVQHYWRC